MDIKARTQPLTPESSIGRRSHTGGAGWVNDPAFPPNPASPRPRSTQLTTEKQ